VYVSWGGVYQEWQKKSYCDPFAAETGARVIQDGPVNEAKIRSMVSAGGDPDWNVIDVTDTFLFNGAAQNLFEKLDFNIVQKSIVAPQYVTEYGVGTCAWSYNVAYSPKAFPAGKSPKTWADLFDIKRFPGKRMFRNRVYATLEIALLADGVDSSKLYPLDVNRALKKLDTIKDHITWWTTPSQSQQRLVDGAVTCGVIQNGRAYDASKKGAPIAIEWAQNLQSVDYLVVLKGTKNLKAAMHLVNRSIQPDAQAKFANNTGYAPVNPSAFSQVDQALTPWLATQKDNLAKGVMLNALWWQDKLEALDSSWNAWRLS
jgi:putative spermidine/putrescine transport system substrate-binding protein